MPAQLDEEEVEEILDTFEESDSCREAADELPHHYNTVVKYVKQAYDEGDSRVEHFDAKDEFDDSGQWDGAGPGVSPFGDEDDLDLDRDYVGMGPGDFLEEFFGDFEVGVKRSWVRIQARRADRRGMIPTKESIKKDILRMKSGIAGSAHQEADYIADEYWAEAQEYIRKTGGQVDPQTMSNENATGQAQGMGPGGVNSNGQGFVSPTQGHQQPQQQPDPQKQMFEMMMNEMKQMRQEMRQLRQGGDDGAGSSQRLETLRMLKEEKEILEEIEGGDEHIQQLQQQIQQLQQQQLQESQGGQAPAPNPGASLEDRLVELASHDDSVSLAEVIDVIEKRQESMDDPAVIEKKHEKELKEMEMEQQQERYNKIGTIGENLFERLGEGFASRIAEGDGDTVEPQDAAPQEELSTNGSMEADDETPDVEQAAAQPQDPATQECPKCGEDMHVGPNSANCPECGYGVGPCDLCGFPVQIPPHGEAPLARCGGCEEPIKVPDDPDAEVTCDECEWEGTGNELRGELIECDNCDEIRPIVRNDDIEAQREQMNELLES